MSAPNATRQAIFVARRRAAGLVQLKLWLHPDDREAVRRYAAKLAMRRALDKPQQDGS